MTACMLPKNVPHNTVTCDWWGEYW